MEILVYNVQVIQIWGFSQFYKIICFEAVIATKHELN